jgi:hypothetical protein
MDQKIKTYYPSPGHAKRVALNKKLRDEQSPSLKNKVKRALKSILDVADKAGKKIAESKIDGKKIDRIERDLLWDMDSKLKKIGPTATNSWINPPVIPTIVKKKKKAKKVK